MVNHNRTISQLCKDDWVAYLDEVNWDWFATGTWTKELSLESARGFTESYFENLESRLRIPVKRFWVLEPHKYRPCPHVHALVGGVDRVKDSARIAWELWRDRSLGGRFRTDIFRRNSKEWGSYLFKYVLKADFEQADYDCENLDK